MLLKGHIVPFEFRVGFFKAFNLSFMKNNSPVTAAADTTVESQEKNSQQQQKKEEELPGQRPCLNPGPRTPAADMLRSC